MRALVYTAPNHVEVQTRPDPVPEPGEFLVRVAATGICGSDLHGFLGHHARRQPGLVLGHETVGMLASGPDEGLRVAVNPLISCGFCRACLAGRENTCLSWRLLGLDQTQGAFAELITIPERNVHALPNHVPDASAVLIEPLANAIHLLGLLPTEAHRGLVIGGGTLGTLIFLVAREWGLEIEAVVEPNPKRAEALRALGAPRVIDPGQEELPGGMDFTVDAVGREVTRQAAVHAVEKGGTVLLLGLDDRDTTLDFQDVVRRELTLQGSFAFTPTDFADALGLVAEGEIDLSSYTDVFPLEEGQNAFERLATDPGDRLKILLTP